MESKKIKINGIPAILYGSKTENCFLFIHGKMGCKEEGEAFAEIALLHGWQVLAVDLPGHGERQQEIDSFVPWQVVPELRGIYDYMKTSWRHLGLRANSIGAWFALMSFAGEDFAQCMFVSPLLDMEKLIEKNMHNAKISVDELKAKQTICTEDGADLSWRYYTFAAENPVRAWRSKTAILFASCDGLTARETVDDFARRFHCDLTVTDRGAHWFHTPEQLSVLNRWTEKNIIDMKI